MPARQEEHLHRAVRADRLLDLCRRHRPPIEIGCREPELGRIGKRFRRRSPTVQFAHDARSRRNNRLAGSPQHRELRTLDVDLDHVGQAFTCVDDFVERHRLELERPTPRIGSHLGRRRPEAVLLRRRARDEDDGAALVCDRTCDDAGNRAAVQLEVAAQPLGDVGIRREGDDPTQRAGFALCEDCEEARVRADVVDDLSVADHPDKRRLDRGLVAAEPVSLLVTEVEQQSRPCELAAADANFANRPGAQRTR